MPTTLTDTQSILLAAAAGRADRSLLPIPSSITAPAGGVAKSLASLVRRGFAEERETSDAALVHRTDGDLRYGLFATPAGLQAIGVEEPLPEAVASDAGAGAEASTPSPAPRSGSKAELVLDLLRRAEGATLAELVAATGWLPHTMRAALTGLRKKGHAIGKGVRDGATCYRLAAAVAG